MVALASSVMANSTSLINTTI
ncbi:hypothetical protein LCGC14_2623270, partial [marine sediment metagenome]